MRKLFSLMAVSSLMMSTTVYAQDVRSVIHGSNPIIQSLCSINADPTHRIAFDNSKRPAKYPQRAEVSNSTSKWSNTKPYNPVPFTDPTVIENDRTIKPKGWADPQDIKKLQEQGVSFRKMSSLLGNILYSKDGFPLNPCGKTGIKERGLLGKWGPNLAADPIITRYSPKTGHLQMLAIKREDNRQWAIPGGMVDDGDSVGRTLEKEFKEEAGLDLKMTGAITIYQGYVDDPRNTDNAWIETVAKYMHLAANHPVAKMEPVAGDDAAKAQWKDITEEFVNSLYASHPLFVKVAIKDMPLVDPNFLPPQDTNQTDPAIMPGRTDAITSTERVINLPPEGEFSSIDSGVDPKTTPSTTERKDELLNSLNQVCQQLNKRSSPN